MPGPRDQETIEGFDRMQHLGIRLIRKHHPVIPKGEYDQVAALAAAETIHTYGETTILQSAVPAIRHVLRDQEHAYGRRQGTRENGSYGNMLYDTPLSTMGLEESELHRDVHLGKLIGVGDYTRKISSALHGREPDTYRPTRKAAPYYDALKKLLKENPELRWLKEQWEAAPRCSMAELFRDNPKDYNRAAWTLKKIRPKARELLSWAERVGDYSKSVVEVG